MNLHKVKEELYSTDRMAEFLETDVTIIKAWVVQVRYAGVLLRLVCDFDPSNTPIKVLFPDLKSVIYTRTILETEMATKRLYEPASD